MTSTALLDRRFARVLLLLGGVALALTGVLAGLHVACDHAADDAETSHGCVICRHLNDGLLLAEPVWSASVAELVAVVIAGAEPNVDCLPRPARRGRAPAVNVPVS